MFFVCVLCLDLLTVSNRVTIRDPASETQDPCQQTTPQAGNIRAGVDCEVVCDASDGHHGVHRWRVDYVDLLHNIFVSALLGLISL